MKTRTMIYGGGAILIAAALYLEASPTLVAVIFLGMLMFIFMHNIEVKVNKLLDHHRIHVTDKELAE